MKDKIVGKRGPIRGRCLECDVLFRSYDKKKKFCSMACYAKSPLMKETIRLSNEKAAARARIKAGLKPGERPSKRCLECDEKFYVRPSQYKSKKYCSQVCYRAYMAKRFDRWIADPQGIALPQCYDEFLIKGELPCLIDGCDWIGENLGNHVNFTHGITASEFKRMVGFNEKTGLITPRLFKMFSERAKKTIAKHGVSAAFLENNGSSVGPHKRSLEAKEHSGKALALRVAEYDESTARTSLCRQCQKEFRHNPLSAVRLYCNDACRTAYYRGRRFDLSCNHCGLEFLGTSVQELRVRRELPVFCSNSCKGARNIAVGLPKRRETLKRKVAADEPADRSLSPPSEAAEP